RNGCECGRTAVRSRDRLTNAEPASPSDEARPALCRCDGQSLNLQERETRQMSGTRANTIADRNPHSMHAPDSRVNPPTCTKFADEPLIVGNSHPDCRAAGDIRYRTDGLHFWPLQEGKVPWKE